VSNEFLSKLFIICSTGNSTDTSLACLGPKTSHFKIARAQPYRIKTNPPQQHATRKAEMEACSLVADFLGRAILLHGFRLSSRPVLVRPAYVDRVVPTQPAVPREHVGAEHTCASHEHRIELPSKEPQTQRRRGIIWGDRGCTQPMMLPRWGTLLT
jgi:hypothetical protein